MKNERVQRDNSGKTTKIMGITSKILFLCFLYLYCFPGVISAQSGNETIIVFDNLRKTSPDRQYVVEVTAQNLGMANSMIWLSTLDGSEKKLLVSGNENYWVTNPIWSPDSTQIAYLKVIKKKHSDFDIIYTFELWAIKRDGSNERLLTDTSFLQPSLGYGGQTNITWNEPEEIRFYDNTTFPAKVYALHVETGYIQLISESPPPMQGEWRLERQPSNVPYYNQCNSTWGGNLIGQPGHCSETICSVGCALTSVAMVLRYLGDNVDPGSLNAWLRNHGGYSGCLIYWSVPANHDQNIQYVTSFYTTDKTRVRQELDAGYPVIVGVNVVNGNPRHYVVVTRYTGSSPSYTYYINDPAWTNRTTLANYNNAIGYIVVYHGPVGSNLCGSISGTLSASNSPYTLTCPVTVERGSSLYIEPGVELNYNGNSFTVLGTLTWGQ